jgi:opacity protein-like surface antigen
MGYQAGAGVSYHLSSNFDLDFGYRYIKKGSKEYKFRIESLDASVVAKTGQYMPLLLESEAHFSSFTPT